MRSVSVPPGFLLAYHNEMKTVMRSTVVSVLIIAVCPGRNCQRKTYPASGRFFALVYIGVLLITGLFQIRLSHTSIFSSVSCLDSSVAVFLFHLLLLDMWEPNLNLQ